MDKISPRAGPKARATAMGPFVANPGGVFETYANYVQDLLPLQALHQSVRALAAKARSVDSDPPQTGATYQPQWERFISIDQCDYLLLSLPDVLQIWNVKDLLNIHELATVPSGALAAAQILPEPELLEGADDMFVQHRPLVAMAPIMQDNDMKECGCPVYSLRSQAVIHTLIVDGIPLDIKASKRVVVVVTATNIYVYSAVNLQPRSKILTRRENSGPVPVALGTRWLAYATAMTDGNASLSTDQSGATAGPPDYNYARELASGLFHMGGKGYAAVTSYLVQSPSEPEPNVIGIAGTVVVRDVVTGELAAVFTAHTTHSIGQLAFNPCGTLLATASTQGRSFNIYSFTAPLSEIPSGASQPLLVPRHMYRLSRGLTNATIHRIAFSKDSRWVAFTTSHGTSHIFAICPWGGPPTPQTHLPTTIENIKVYSSAGADVLANTRARPPDNFGTVARIRPPQQVLEESDIPAAVYFTGRICLGRKGGQMVHGEGLVAVDHRRMMTHYVLEVDANNEMPMAVTVRPVVAWNLAEQPYGLDGSQTLSKAKDDDSHQTAVKGGTGKEEQDTASAFNTARLHASVPRNAAVSHPVMQGPRQWLSQVELATHHSPLPLHATPQFTMKRVSHVSAETAILLAQTHPTESPTNGSGDSQELVAATASEELQDHLASALDDNIPQAPRHTGEIDGRLPAGGSELGLDLLFFHHEALPIYPKGGRVLTVDDTAGSQIWWQRMSYSSNHHVIFEEADQQRRLEIAPATLMLCHLVQAEAEDVAETADGCHASKTRVLNL